MKKFIVAVLFVLICSPLFSASTQVVEIVNKTGWISVTGTACNISGFQFWDVTTSAPGITITVFDCALTQSVDSTSNTLCYFTSAVMNKIWSATGDTAQIIKTRTEADWSASASLFNITKPTAVYKKATKGIVFYAPSDLSFTASVYLTVE